jgi:hypothetical protein
MAIKGNAYLKTTWAYQERPVGSTKLNTWDDRIEGALELVHFLLSQAWGGGDGVVRHAATDDLRVAATSPEGLSVEVKAGYAFISNLPFKLAETTETAEVTVPSANPRIDLVQARLASWDVSIVTGVESATPATPSPDADCIALAALYLRPGMTVIADADDLTNGYIIDARAFL